MISVQFVVYTVHCELCNVECALCTVPLYTIKCILCSGQCGEYMLQCAVLNFAVLTNKVHENPLLDHLLLN